jgi:4-amino-4-deoxy-L-arabinose transferase-like glycosyltransferase
LFAAALALRIGATFALDTPSIGRGASAWNFGHEPACIAQALLDGRGYADPWGKGTDATAWLTPPYPLFLAACFKWCGGVSYGVAALVMLVQSVASALTAVLLVALGREVGSARVGKLAGWLFALYPIAVSNAVQLVWDTTFVACFLTIVVIALLRVRSAASAARAGLAFGALLMLNPAPLSLVPVAAVFTWRRARGRGLAAFLACAFAVCLPWLIRNEVKLGSFSLRPNFGVEMRIGNHDDANGRPVPFKYHPSHVASELALYRELGEVEYASENMGRALAWISDHPARFAALTLRRVG